MSSSGMGRVVHPLTLSSQHFLTHPPRCHEEWFYRGYYHSFIFTECCLTKASPTHILFPFASASTLTTFSNCPPLFICFYIRRREHTRIAFTFFFFFYTLNERNNTKTSFTFCFGKWNKIDQNDICFDLR